MEIKGYKAFNKDMTNRYGTQFEEGKVYEVDNGESIRFGNTGNGFHFCERLEDTLRYFPAMEEEIKIAAVTGSGEIVTYDDDYYGYYDMHAASRISIDRILERDEIVGMFLDVRCPDIRVKRFVSLFKLTNDEIRELLEKKSYNDTLLPTILYYQFKDHDAFNRLNNSNIVNGTIKIKK